ncbi:hypothetical protein L596_027125 [Steinernema carpocapsae]|uniref:Uncharacterized protein n=1 Tax=Steinernema carpocapsae TaxID=34508 RepID=A0A4U5M3H1_STECR|nr:hypothetical protein L596_027125 [Steinernema carpocapsae]
MFLVLPLLLLTVVPLSYSSDPIYILPIKDSSNWRYAINSTKPLSSLNEFPTAKQISGVNFNESAEKWITVTPHFAEKQLIAFLNARLQKRPLLTMTRPPSEEMTAIARIFLPGLVKQQFERIELGYYGQVSEDFVTAQVQNGNPSPELTLTGKWPATVKDLLKTYQENEGTPHHS